jgi:tetratricopeptide (TPR) repeat protein
MGYWTYYLLTFALAYATRYPALAVLVIVFYAARPYLPDPVVWIRTWGRIRALESEIELNPSNMIATRDLARLHLERRRPKKAIVLLEKTRQRMAESTRHPQGSLDDAEILFTLGDARIRAGDIAGALEPLVGAVAIAPEIGRGEPYLLASRALMKLERWEEAEDAVDRYIGHNRSSLEAYVRLAQVRLKRKDEKGSKEALAEARATWNVLPAFKRRHEWKWWLLALTAPVWMGS